MLSLNDFNEKLILFIFNKEKINSQIKFWNDNIRLYENEKFTNQISCHKVYAVYIVGDCSITSFLIRKLKQFGISIFFLNRNFSCYSSISPMTEGNYLLRLRQYQYDKSLVFSRNLIKNKIYNQLVFATQTAAGAKLIYDKHSDNLNSQKTIQTILGVEGSASRKYFSNVFKKYDWKGRKPRTKCDEINLIMDIGYTILFNFIDSLLLLYGFDTYKGVYHQQFYARKSLTCDIVEPFRVIIDRQIIKSLNLKQFKKTDFKKENGRYLLKYQYQDKYYTTLSQVILDHRQDIHKFVHQTYRHFINYDNPLPFYKFNLR